MKKLLTVFLTALVAVSFAFCGGNSETVRTADTEQTGTAATSSTGATETTGTFSIKSADGEFSTSGNICTITSGGTYSVSGLLEGQIVVNAGSSAEVILELNGVAITYGSDSPIKILSADSVDISARSGTINTIDDIRSARKTDDSTQGQGAVYAKCDLKIKGSGTLIVNAGYYNGIHTTKDLTIQKLTLTVTARNTALKGNNSVTVTSGTVTAISTNGDGIKTENTDVSKKGVTRGDITISGGTVTVYSAGDGIQAAHDFWMTGGTDGNPATITIYTGSYSSYTASDASTSSYKGVKVQNELNITDGDITIHSYDDGLHADYGTALDDGTKGQGTVNISGGTVTMTVYSPENKTAGGRQGMGWGWGGQQTVIGADGIHADSILNISGGTINIDSAYEGLEANVINISGGTTYVAANDDGVNACRGNATPQVNVTGGYLDVTVSPNGDTDGIDSNGTYKQSGGIVIARGPNSQMAAAIDADSSVSITGGTLIILGYGKVSKASGVSKYSLSLHSAGTQSVKINGTTYTFTNANAYGMTTVYSDVSVTK